MYKQEFLGHEVCFQPLERKVRMVRTKLFPGKHNTHVYSVQIGKPRRNKVKIPVNSYMSNQ